MKNYVQTGDILELTAPVGGVVSGGTYVIGELTVISSVDADAGDAFNASHAGVFQVEVEAADTPAEGDNAYYDGGTGKWTTVAGALKLGGYFVGAKIGSTDYANVKLLG